MIDLDKYKNSFQAKRIKELMPLVDDEEVKRALGEPTLFEKIENAVKMIDPSAHTHMELDTHPDQDAVFVPNTQDLISVPLYYLEVDKTEEKDREKDRALFLDAIIEILENENAKEGRIVKYYVDPNSLCILGMDFYYLYPPNEVVVLAQDLYNKINRGFFKSITSMTNEDLLPSTDHNEMKDCPTANFNNLTNFTSFLEINPHAIPVSKDFAQMSFSFIFSINVLFNNSKQTKIFIDQMWKNGIDNTEILKFLGVPTDGDFTFRNMDYSQVYETVSLTIEFFKEINFCDEGFW